MIEQYILKVYDDIKHEEVKYYLSAPAITDSDREYHYSMHFTGKCSKHWITD